MTAGHLDRIGEQKGARNEGQGSSSDRRPLILVLIGVSVLLSHFIVTLYPSRISQPNQGNPGQRLVWLGSTDLVPDGLYWLDTKDLRGGWKKEFSRPTHLPVQVAPILFQLIAINQADRDTLMIIPGIGSRIAEAIIHYRDSEGRIENQDTLMKIDGIGTIKSAVINDYVRFDD